jgi:chemotaxis protein MotB
MHKDDYSENKSQHIDKISEPRRNLFPSDEGETEDGEAWLTSYADMMTLVACFFILMMAFANFDQPTFKRVAKEVEKHFKGANLQVEKDENTELVTKINSISQLTDQLQVMVHPEGVEIKFNSGFLFDSGESDLTLNAAELLRLLSEVIGEKKDKYIIEVHGHTDSSPLVKSKRYRDNWELSAARAASVVKEFAALGFSPKILQAIGHADSAPDFPETDKSGQLNFINMSRNRRVVIFVRDIYPSEKLGLGVKFEENK